MDLSSTDIYFCSRDSSVCTRDSTSCSGRKLTRKAGAGNSIGRPRPPSLARLQPSRLAYRALFASFNPAADLICRYFGGEAEVHAIRRHRARNEGRRLGHGVDFLLPASQQSALLPPIVARAYSAEERQTRRSQSPGTSRPEDHQHPRDLRERRWHRI